MRTWPASIHSPALIHGGPIATDFLAGVGIAGGGGNFYLNPPSDGIPQLLTYPGMPLRTFRDRGNDVFSFFFFDIYWRAAAATEWLESNNMTDICCRCCVQFLAFKRERERERKRGGEGKERKKDGKKDRK